MDDRTVSDAAVPVDYRATKAAIGALAVVAAAAAATGPAMTASLFGALIALALSAGAGVAALLELQAPDGDRVWRVAAWGSLVPAWIVFAAMLLHAPLLNLDGLRVLASVLLLGGALLRTWRSLAQREAASPGVTLALIFTALAFGATWIGVWVQLGATAVTAINVACALELFGCGSLWLVEAFLLPTGRAGAVAPVSRPRGATQMA